MVGDLPSAYPTSRYPTSTPQTCRTSRPGALAIVLVGDAEALGGAKAAASRAAATSIRTKNSSRMGRPIFKRSFGGFLVVGSLSKTSVAMAAGARTQVANSSPRSSASLRWFC